MSSSSSSAGEDFKTLTRNDEKESKTKEEESVSVQSLEEKSLQKDSTAKEEPVSVQSLEETSLTLTSPDDKDSTVDVQSAVETSTSKDDKDSTIKESSVSIQSVEEELLTSTSKDGRDYDFKESAREEFQASTSKESVFVPSARDKFLTLRSKDNQEFTVAESVAFQSPYIKRMVKDGSASTGIHIPEIEGMALAPVLEYLNMKYRESEASDEDKRKYELEELVRKELGYLFDFLFAAEFLKIRDLPEIINQAIRDNIKNIQLPDSPELPHDIDYDPFLEEDDDEENVRAEYPSDFDD